MVDSNYKEISKDIFRYIVDKYIKDADYENKDVIPSVLVSLLKIHNAFLACFIATFVSEEEDKAKVVRAFLDVFKTDIQKVLPDYDISFIVHKK